MPSESRNPESFEQRVGKLAARKQKALRADQRSVWSGLATFGMIGWSVVVPTIAGTALGIWLDRHHPQAGISWTLTLLVTGLGFGCLMAWRWVEKEHKDMHEQDQHQNHE